eukprot:3144152-Amphidinium_carterae.2
MVVQLSSPTAYAKACLTIGSTRMGGFHCGTARCGGRTRKLCCESAGLPQVFHAEVDKVLLPALVHHVAIGSDIRFSQTDSKHEVPLAHTHQKWRGWKRLTRDCMQVDFRTGLRNKTTPINNVGSLRGLV